MQAAVLLFLGWHQLFGLDVGAFWSRTMFLAYFTPSCPITGNGDGGRFFVPKRKINGGGPDCILIFLFRSV
jgi:hypothetical protein